MMFSASALALFALSAAVSADIVQPSTADDFFQTCPNTGCVV
jgi:hypothetical protein